MKEITLGIVNATLADDDVLARAGFLELEEYSNALISKYGSHPVLLETLADFAPDPEMQLELYRKASEESLTRKMPIHTIHISWARVLLDHREYQTALRVLELCSSDVTAWADEQERAEFAGLVASCRREGTPKC